MMDVTMNATIVARTTRRRTAHLIALTASTLKAQEGTQKTNHAQHYVRIVDRSAVVARARRAAGRTSHTARVAVTKSQRMRGSSHASNPSPMRVL
tara:strand:+ start:301 stop:585 length:285 start_codon:yes stop_codon:yes gene_type:complete